MLKSRYVLRAVIAGWGLSEHLSTIRLDEGTMQLTAISDELAVMVLDCLMVSAFSAQNNVGFTLSRPSKSVHLNDC